MPQHGDAAVAFDVTQLNWMTRRSPSKGLWPCQELSERLNASSVPAAGGTSMIGSSRPELDFNSRSRPPECSHAGFMKIDLEDLAFGVSVDAAVARAAAAAHRDRMGAIHQVDIEFVGEGGAEFVAASSSRKVWNAGPKASWPTGKLPLSPIFG